MIVKYIWHTNRYHVRSREHHVRIWHGWFLLGFIPLYVKTAHLTVQ